MKSVLNYIDANKMQRREAQDIIDEFDEELSNMHGRCLDIGSGPGDVTNELLLPHLPIDADVVGADISACMTDHARRIYANEKRLSFIILNIEESNLPNNEIEHYDHVISFFCLHWCQDVRLAFNNIYQLLRPGGTALVQFLAHHDGFEAYDTLPRNVPRYAPYMEDTSRYTPYFQRQKSKNPRAHLRQILIEIGFEVLHCSRREKSYIYKNRETLRKHIAAVNPFVSQMPDDIKGEFINDMTDEIMKKQLLIEKVENQVLEECMIYDRYYVLLAYMKK